MLSCFDAREPSSAPSPPTTVHIDPATRPDKVLERYAMLVLCGRRWVSTCSVTRRICPRCPMDDLRRKQEAATHLDAAMIAETRQEINLGISSATESQSAWKAAGLKINNSTTRAGRQSAEQGSTWQCQSRQKS